MKNLIATLITYFTLTTASAETINGRIVGVSDGDTVTLLTPERARIRIRLAQIDAPEKSQAFGERSKKALSDLTFNKEVTVEAREKDRFGRTIGTIFVNGKDANLEQIKTGMAWVYTQYSRSAEYRKAEAEARRRSIGLWSDKDPTPPWNFRREASR